MLTDLSKNAPTSAAERNRAVRILAKSITRELTAAGYDERQIVLLATELISEVTHRISSGGGENVSASGDGAGTAGASSAGASSAGASSAGASSAGASSAGASSVAGSTSGGAIRATGSVSSPRD
jgi:hypothetical protein